MVLCAVARWQVSKANAKTHLEKIREIVEWVKQNRRLLYFTHSTYCILETEDPSVETWLNIDEYEDQESYDEFAKTFTRSSPDWVGFFRVEEEVKSLLVPNSMTHEVFVEKPELRIA